MRAQPYAQADPFREFLVRPSRHPIAPCPFRTISALQLYSVNGHDCLRAKFRLPCGNLAAYRSARIQIIDEQQIDALFCELRS